MNWHQDNREYHAAWYQAHKERHDAQKREWRKKNQVRERAFRRMRTLRAKEDARTIKEEEMNELVGLARKYQRGKMS